MKKLFVAASIGFLLLTGCGAKTDVGGTEESSTFIMTEETLYYRVLYHRETKVMYVAGKSSFTFTVLVDADGKPLLYEGVEE